MQRILWASPSQRTVFHLAVPSRPQVVRTVLRTLILPKSRVLVVSNALLDNKVRSVPKIEKIKLKYCLVLVLALLTVCPELEFCNFI